MVVKKQLFFPYIFSCKNCDYNTNKKSSYDKHILTAKHQNGSILSEKLPEKLLETEPKKLPKVAQKVAPNFACECGKKYKYDSGFYRHKKICKLFEDSNNINTLLTEKELISMLIKQNEILIQQHAGLIEKHSGLMEQNAGLIAIVKNGTSHTNITHTNSHNKTFNLQFFLNEQCKDALNIAEFVNSIKPQLNDLEATGRLGYVEGVSRIINKNLKELDTFKRPIHCSDLKRETLYIKNNDEWQKEENDKPILTKAIKEVANENIKQIREWKKEYPDCTDSESNKNNLFLKIVSNSMSGGTSEEQLKNYEKIVTNIAKEVVIEKNIMNSL